MQVDVFVAGFSKCGTTTLCHLLDKHPGIYVPAEKETWYFIAGDYDDGLAGIEYFYRDSKPGQLLLDGTPTYSSYEKEELALTRILASCPQARFVFIARDPRQRIESSYREMHHSSPLFGFDTPYDLGEAMQMLPQMVMDSMYWTRISRYREVFGDERILVMFLEDLVADRERELRRCFDFLGLEPLAGIDAEPVALNTGSSKRMDTRLLRKIRNNRFLGPRLALIPATAQDRLLVPLGLRRRSVRTVDWTPEAERAFSETVAPDARRFLEFYGKPADFWPGIAGS
jgi:hypothetical protein